MTRDDAPTDTRMPDSLWQRWPLTTICGLTGLIALSALLATDMSSLPSPVTVVVTGEREVVAAGTIDEFLTHVGLDGDDGEAGDAEAAPEEEPSDEAGGVGTRHKGEEGVMGRPAPGTKRGLYAMKGPKNAIPTMARDFDPSRSARETGVLGVLAPSGAAMAVGDDDGDVWGGLAGTEVGEAFGVGGLGLVGTGHGGGGFGSGGARSIADGTGSYSRAIQSRVLTVGTVDDNADPEGYRAALEDLAQERAALQVPDDMWTLAPPHPRHDAQPGSVDIAVVIDTTGSMGDELEYLKVEVRDIAREIDETFPGIKQRWGMVVYRDHGDEYVTRTTDLTTLDDFVTSLGRQQAGGGGDYPEALDEALQRSADLSWRMGQGAARMVFLVADAPSHAGSAAQHFADAVAKHRRDRTAIYPVAGSGADGQVEVQLRGAARATGGQYIFLTDHSGVGAPHDKPHVDQYKVETLHDAMVRMVRCELGSSNACEKPTRGPAPTRPPAPTITPTTPPDAPAVAVMSAATPVEAPEERSFWDTLMERLATHFLFASGVTLAVFAAMGVDTLARRRRRRDFQQRGL